MHGTGSPSPWLERWATLLPATGTALDLACGAGRHLRWLADRGLRPTGIDRDAAALAACGDVAGAELIAADVENGPWPCPGRRFDVVVVTNYLWRPLWPAILASLAPGGVLLYETFADGNQTVGKPSRPDFLLQPGELLRHCAGLTVVGYEHGFLDAPPRFVQRVAAVRPAAAGDAHPRHPLPAA
jgi:SAM-dependent methyltransferase